MLSKAKMDNLTVCFAFSYMQRGQRIEVKQEHYVYNLNLSTLSIKMNYDFRIRMKLWCVNYNWSNWTKVQSWGNNKGTVSLSLKKHVFRFMTRDKCELNGH